jgi:hypothetical protein
MIGIVGHAAAAALRGYAASPGRGGEFAKMIWTSHVRGRAASPGRGGEFAKMI